VGSIRQSSGSIYKGYFRALYLSRMTLVAFWASFFYFVVWAIPWIPGGLSRGDYTRQFIVTMAFGGACMLLGLLAATFRAAARQRREALVAWTSVYDQATGLHNRRHFYDRLSLECERSERYGSSFGLILLTLEPPAGVGGRQAGRGGASLRPGAELVKSLTRSTDLVALISNSEFAVLILDVGKEQAVQLADRLRQSVSTRLPALVSGADSSAWPIIKVGVSTYGEDGLTPESLVEAARSSLRTKDDKDSTAAEAAA
jgi:diguanylate cyclase (GGDEF)-like protein